jgi:hypothetical protein
MGDPAIPVCNLDACDIQDCPYWNYSIQRMDYRQRVDRFVAVKGSARPYDEKPTNSDSR